MATKTYAQMSPNERLRVRMTVNAAIERKAASLREDAEVRSASEEYGRALKLYERLSAHLNTERRAEVLALLDRAKRALEERKRSGAKN